MKYFQARVRQKETKVSERSLPHSQTQDSFSEAHLPAAEKLIRISELKASSASSNQEKLLATSETHQRKTRKTIHSLRGTGLSSWHQKSLFFTLINMYFPPAYKESPGVQRRTLQKAAQPAAARGPSPSPWSSGDRTWAGARSMESALQPPKHSVSYPSF